MLNKKLIITTGISVILSLFFSLNALAFDDVNMGFDRDTAGWTRTSASGEISLETVDGENCITINSPGVSAVYERTLDESITSDGKVYVLSYDVLIPNINTGSSVKQTVVLEGHGSNDVNALYGLRIDNGVISYFNGKGQYNISTAYSGGNKLTVSANEWHNLKSVYNRTSGTFRYYVDDVPLLNEDGTILEVSVYSNVADYTITKLVLRSRNVSEDDKIYIDNVSVAESTLDYTGEYNNFEAEASAWSYESGTNGTISTSVIDENYGNSVSIASPGVLTTYIKALEETVPANNKMYVMSYDLFISNRYTGTPKQTVALIGRASNKVPAFYGLRIDNGVVSYYNGQGQYNVSTAYSNGEPLLLEESKWHNIKTVYDRASAMFTYYIDDVPLRSVKGDIIRVRPWTKATNYNITQLALMMRCAEGYEVYADNISVMQTENHMDKTGVNIYDFSLKDDSGAEVDISDISGKEKLVASFEYDSNENFMPIVALYEGSTLKDIVYKKTDVSKNGYNSTYSFELTNTKGADNAKIFVWDSFENIVPYGFSKKSDNQSEIGIRLDSPLIENEDFTVQRTQKSADEFYSFNEGFGKGTANWVLKSTLGTMSAVNVDSRHGNSITINSDHVNHSVFKKQLATSITADNKIYSLSYSVFIPEIKTGSPKQSVAVTAQASDGADSFLSLRIDNGEVSYYDGVSISSVSAAYNASGERITVSKNKWNVLKTVYDRQTGMFAFFVNGDAVYDADGNIANVHILHNLADDEITQVAIQVRNVNDSDMIYIDNVAVLEEEILTAEKNSVTGVVLRAPVMDYDVTTARKKKYSADQGPVETCYIDFTVNNKSFLKRSDGSNYEIEVEYFDEGYGCFTLEYDTITESLKEAEYVELENTCQWKTHVFELENAYFTGDGTDFRLATWGEKMRYSNTDVVFSNLYIGNSFERDQYIIESTGSVVGNIYYTGETPAFTTTVSNRDFYEYSNAFGSYDATLRYTLLDENKNPVKVIQEKAVTINPISSITFDVSFNVDKYGLYYLKTEVICDAYSLYGADETEFSYVHSDKETVNPDFGTSAQVSIFSDSVTGEENIAKNAGIGMVRWIRGMGQVMNLTYDSSGPTLTKKGFDSWTEYDEIFKNSEYTVLNCLLAGNMIYSDETKNGYKLHIPYGDTGRDLFAQYCRYFAENDSSDTKYYEIWNEFDSPAGTSFNMNGEDLRNYGNLLVKAADEVYAVDENAELISVVSSHAATHEKVIERVKTLVGEENVSKYFKNASVHPYHWNDNPLYIENTVTGEVSNMYEHLMDVRKVYDDAGLTDTKLWVTEVAWSPHYTDYNDIRNFPENVSILDNPEKAFRKPITEKQQGSYIVQSYVMLKKDNLVDKFLPYLFARQTDARADRDKNMGIIKPYSSSVADVPYAATSAYLAVANLNMLLTGATYVDDFTFDSTSAVAYRYLRSNGENIAILWSGLEEGETVNINLGCDTITVYDEYGNTETRTSSNGIYEFNLTQSTVYITGEFTVFERK